MKRFMTAALAWVAVATLGAANDAGWSCPSQLGSLPFGPTYEVAVAGDLGLVSNGALLEIINLADPTGLAPVGEVTLPDVIVAVAVRPFEDRLYVADLSGVAAVDITDPAHPSVFGRLTVAGEPRDVEAVGGIVYLADSDLGLRIVDFSDPANPVELSSLASPGSAWEVAVALPYAYLADFDGGLRVIDVSVPSAPVEVGEYRPADAPYVLHVALDGDIAAVTVWDGGGGSLRTLGIADPTAPQELGVFSMIDGPTALAVIESTAYVAEGYYGGVHEVDISDPASPSLADRVRGYPDDVTALAASERWLIGGIPSIGAVVHDRAGGSGTSRGWYETVGPVVSVAAAAGRVYAGGGGMRIVDAENPRGLVELGAWEDVEDGRPVFGWVGAAAVAGNNAYLGWSNTGLVVLDVSQPAATIEVASVPSLRGLVKDLAVAGDYLLVAAGGLEVLDVSRPEAPLAVASLPLAGATRLAVTGDIALLTLWGAAGEALAVVDLTTPTAPVLVATLPLPCPPADVVAAGGFAFVGCATSGVAAIDLAVPSAPVVVGWLGRPAAVNVGALAVSNNCLYVLEGDGGAGGGWLRAVDIADPSAMRSVGVAATGGGAHDLTMVGRKVAVADGDGGVALFAPTSCSCGLIRKPSSLD